MREDRRMTIAPDDNFLPAAEPRVRVTGELADADPAVDPALDPALDAASVGIGPWVGEWPQDDRYDPDLLADGDRRNVVDEFRYWRVDAIVAELDTRRHPFHVAIVNWAHDFNIGSVVR